MRANVIIVTQTWMMFFLVQITAVETWKQQQSNRAGRMTASVQFNNSSTNGPGLLAKAPAQPNGPSTPHTLPPLHVVPFRFGVMASPHLPQERQGLLPKTVGVTHVREDDLLA